MPNEAVQFYLCLYLEVLHDFNREMEGNITT